MYNLKKLAFSLVCATLMLSTVASANTVIDEKFIQEQINSGHMQFGGNLNDADFIKNMTDKLHDPNEQIPKAALYFMRGLAYMQRGKYVESADDIALSIDNGNTTHDVYFQCASVNFYAKRYDKTIEYAQKAIDMKKNSFEAYTLIGAAYANMPGKTQEAIAAFNKSIKMNTKNPAAYEGLISIYIQDVVQYNTLLEPLGNKLVELDASNADNYIKRGIINTKLGNYTKALIDFDQALRLNPQDTRLYLFKEEVYGNMHEFKSALEQNEKYLNAISTGDVAKNFEGYWRRGILYFKLGDEKTGIEYLKKAEQIQPNPIVPRLIGASYYKPKDYPLALKVYEDAIQKYPQEIDFYIQIAAIYTKMGDRQRAIDILDKGLMNNPNSAILQNMRAEIAAGKAMLR